MNDQKDVQGLGGWLILVGVGVVVSPFLLLAGLARNYAPLLEVETWYALGFVESTSYVPKLLPLWAFEVVLDVCFFVVSISLVYLFFSRHRLFPTVFIGLSVALPAYIWLDAWLVTVVFPSEPVFDPQTKKALAKSIIKAMTWVPYMLSSRRVKNTFIQPSSAAVGVDALPENLDDHQYLSPLGCRAFRGG